MVHSTFDLSTNAGAPSPKTAHRGGSWLPTRPWARVSHCWFGLYSWHPRSQIYVTFFDGDPRVDGMWTVQNITTKMKVSLTIPYSIYFRMIAYIYINM